VIANTEHRIQNVPKWSEDLAIYQAVLKSSEITSTNLTVWNDRTQEPYMQMGAKLEDMFLLIKNLPVNANLSDTV